MRPDLPSDLTPSERGRVHHYLHLVEQAAHLIAANFPRLVDARELLTPGTLGLHEAVRSHEPERHPDFEQYARYYIHARMLDAVRRDHFSLRARVEHAMERAFAELMMYHDAEVDTFVDDKDVLRQGCREGCGDALAAAVIAALREAEQPSPEDELAERELYAAACACLKAALPTLRAHERTIVELLYWVMLTLRQAAERLRVHVNIAQRRHTSALRRLRIAMKLGGIPRAPRLLDLGARDPALQSFLAGLESGGAARPRRRRPETRSRAKYDALRRIDRSFRLEARCISLLWNVLASITKCVKPRLVFIGRPHRSHR